MIIAVAPMRNATRITIVGPLVQFAASLPPYM
jgi:hypothetical protein